MVELAKKTRVRSWKTIADLMGVSIRTVQRWERTRHLPVYRLGGNAHERVFAFKEELDHWLLTVQRRLGTE